MIASSRSRTCRCGRHGLAPVTPARTVSPSPLRRAAAVRRLILILQGPNPVVTASQKAAAPRGAAITSGWLRPSTAAQRVRAACRDRTRRAAAIPEHLVDGNPFPARSVVVIDGSFLRRLRIGLCVEAKGSACRRSTCVTQICLASAPGRRRERVGRPAAPDPGSSSARSELQGTSRACRRLIRVQPQQKNGCHGRRTLRRVVPADQHLRRSERARKS